MLKSEIEMSDQEQKTCERCGNEWDGELRHDVDEFASTGQKNYNQELCESCHEWAEWCT